MLTKPLVLCVSVCVALLGALAGSGAHADRGRSVDYVLAPVMDVEPIVRARGRVMVESVGFGR